MEVSDHQVINKNIIFIRVPTMPEQSEKKNGGTAVPLSVGGAGSPSNTMSPGPRSISLLSGILIHPAVWSQQTWAKKWGLLCPFQGERWVPI